MADDGDQRIFLKFDVAVDVLRRLAEIGVAPQVLHSGQHRGRSLLIQPYLGRGYPSRDWFDANLMEVARLVGTYHRDTRLRELISPSTEPTHEEHVAQILAGYERRARHVPSGAMRLGLDQAVAALRVQSLDLQTSTLVPTHGDPNNKNFILIDDSHVLLLDWDDIALADPFRDVGQLLWWYVPPNRWSAFLDCLGLATDAGARHSLFWWVAAESLDVAMSLIEHGLPQNAAAFMDDFRAALAQAESARLKNRRRSAEFIRGRGWMTSLESTHSPEVCMG